MLEILFPGIKEGQYTLLIILSCISVALWLLIAVARWSMFTKMGEAGWKAFVPFYGLYILFSKCWSTRAAWNYITGIFVSVLFEFGVFKSTGDIAMIASYICELLVAICMLYLSIRINFRIAKAFGHGAGFGFGLWLFPYIFTFIIGFGKSEYVGNPLLNAKNKH